MGGQSIRLNSEVVEYTDVDTISCGVRQNVGSYSKYECKDYALNNVGDAMMSLMRRAEGLGRGTP